MAMSIQDIRDSGLLELYVLGELKSSDLELVEVALTRFPELKKDILGIEKSLEMYSQMHGITAPAGVMDRILQEINAPSPGITDSAAPKSFGWLVWSLIIAASLFGGYYFWNKVNQEKDTINQQLIDCTAESEAKTARINTLNELNDPDNAIFLVAATEKYPQTRIYLHNNEVNDKTFLQIQNLPELGPDQSFQLWSLKADTNPIPLDVFDSQDSQILEVRHEANTNAYAITIEKKGGSQSPDLDNLIGVFSVAG